MQILARVLILGCWMVNEDVLEKIFKKIQNFFQI